MMVVTVRKATHIIEDSERAINDTLLYIACRPDHSRAPPASGRPWRDDLVDQLEEIADLRFDDQGATRSSGFYSAPLFWEVFGFGGVIRPANVAYRMAQLCRKMKDIWIDRDVDSVTQALYKFHTDFARGCEDGNMNRIKIDVLLYEFKATFNATHHPGTAPVT
jgi:hypothetical protein